MLTKTKNYKPVEIIADGVVSSSDWAEARPIPAIMLDASSRPDIAEYIKAHSNQPPGDIITQWARRLFSSKNVILFLQSTRPIPTKFAIEFSVQDHHTIIEGILISKGLYLQTGTRGDKVSNNLFLMPSILIEVPGTGFAQTWGKILQKSLNSKFKKQGLSHKNAKIATNEYIKSMREFWSWRRADV